MQEHPINSVLVSDILNLLGRSRRTIQKTFTPPTPVRQDKPTEVNPPKATHPIGLEQTSADDQWDDIINRAKAQASILGIEFPLSKSKKVPTKGERIKDLLKKYEDKIMILIVFVFCLLFTIWLFSLTSNSKFSYIHCGASLYFTDSNITLEEYKNEAERGDALAKKTLGSMYYLGEEVAQDYSEAAKWFRKAAEQGFEKAIESLEELGVES